MGAPRQVYEDEEDDEEDFAAATLESYNTASVARRPRSSGARAAPRRSKERSLPSHGPGIRIYASVYGRGKSARGPPG